MVQKLKSATDTVQVLNLVSEQKSLTCSQTMQCLRTIFQLQKAGVSSLTPSQLTRHPEFDDICRSLKRHARQLELNDTIEALKVFSTLSLSANSRIMLTLLSLIRHQVNNVTLGHLIFLDFLLRKFEKTPLVEALTIALPMMFEVQLPQQIDHENVKELIDCLGFVTRNRVSEQCLTSVVTALTLHGVDLTPHQASLVVRFLSDLPSNPRHDKLVANTLAVLAERLDELEFSVVDSVLTKVTDKYYANNAAFYDEAFFNRCAEYAVQKDPTSVYNSFCVLRKFNKISFVNYELLNHVVGYCVKSPQVIETATPGFVITLLSALSIANYITADWELLKDQVLKNPLFQSSKIELPWLKIAIDFMALGGWHQPLIERLFRDDFLEKYFSREKNAIDHYLMLNLYIAVRTLRPDYSGAFPSQKYVSQIEDMPQNVETPLEDSLRYIYGDAVVSRVMTKLGHFIDHVIVFDAAERKPVAVTDVPEKVLVEDLLQVPGRLL